MTRYIAEFTAQVWVNNYAMEVDPQGPTTWDVTDYVSALPDEERERVMVPDDYPSDDLVRATGAPQWCKDWSGPFYVTVEEYEDNHLPTEVT